MNSLDSPFSSARGRTELFLEAKYLVEEQFPSASDEAKMNLIGQLVNAHARLSAAERLAHEVSGALDEISSAIRESGEE